MPCDYRNYPADWFTRIRPAILARAKHCCERCGVSDRSVRNGATIILTIAHLDQDVQNNDFGNLRALCQRCHNTVDAPFRAKHRVTNRRKRLEAQGQTSLL